MFLNYVQVARHLWKGTRPLLVSALFVLTFLTSFETAFTKPTFQVDKNSVMLPLIVRPSLLPICGQVVEFGGQLTVDTVLSPDKTYIVNRSATVNPNVTLTILPGTVLKFANQRGIDVEGKLTAEGDELNPIFFTSTRDDTLCGDTNQDGTASVGSAGDWRWINFAEESDPNSSIRNAVVRYGGRDHDVWSGDIWRAAIRLFSTSPTLGWIKFDMNYRAIDRYGEAPVALECNDVLNNTSYGIYNDNPANPIAAEDHWWGNTSGPTHPSNPSGTGEEVSDGVDFEPWRTSPCTDFGP